MKVETLKNLLEKNENMKIYIVDFFNEQRTDFFTGYVRKFETKRQYVDKFKEELDLCIVKLKPYAGFYVENLVGHGYPLDKKRKSVYSLCLDDKRDLITRSFALHMRQIKPIIKKSFENMKLNDEWRIKGAEEEYRSYLKASEKL